MLKVLLIRLKLLGSHVALLALIVSATGCATDQPPGSEEVPVASPGSDGSAVVNHEPVVPVTDPVETPEARPVVLEPETPVAGCTAQGIGAEESFARATCAAAADLGFRPELVHSFGAGGVDIFISATDASTLRRDPTELRRQMTALTEWAKSNYSGFNAVTVTLVGGQTKIASGRKTGEGATRVELF